MTDIIEALRAIVSDMPTATHRNILEHTAEDLEQLQAENHHLREAVSGRPSSELHEAALAEKDREIARLRSLIVCGFYEDETPTFRQGEPQHELESAVTAEECTGMVAKIERLRAENAALRQTLHDELEGNLRLRALGGSRDDETFPTFIERAFSERATAKALLREAYPWVAYWNINNEALLTCQRIRAALGDRHERVQRDTEAH